MIMVANMNEQELSEMEIPLRAKDHRPTTGKGNFAHCLSKDKNPGIRAVEQSSIRAIEYPSIRAFEYPNIPLARDAAEITMLSC